MKGVILIILVLCCGCVSPSNEPQYGEVATFSKNREILYPDFSVRYLGQRRESSEAFPRGFLYYDFEMATETENEAVSWTAGTGDIAPHLFSIGGKEYFLVLKINELAYEDYMLDDNEMIIWPKDVYLKKLE